MIYCDSSFLVPLYLYEKTSSEKAGKVAAGWQEAAWISPLGELEFTNAVCRKIFANDIMTEGRAFNQTFRVTFPPSPGSSSP